MFSHPSCSCVVEYKASVAYLPKDPQVWRGHQTTTTFERHLPCPAHHLAESRMSLLHKPDKMRRTRCIVEVIVNQGFPNTLPIHGQLALPKLEILGASFGLWQKPRSSEPLMRESRGQSLHMSPGASQNAGTSSHPN